MRVLLVALLVSGIAVAGPDAAPAGAHGSCAGMGGTVETGQICHIQETTPTYMLDLRFPVDYPDQQALTDYVAQNRDGFITVAQGPGPPEMPYEMDGTAEQHNSGQPSKGTKSVVLKIFQDVGGPHPSTWYKSFNYNLGTGKPVEFDTLFAADTKPLEAVYPLVQRDLERQLGPGTAVLPGDGLDPGHYQNFAITDDELIFYFAPGELLPLNAGANAVRLPRKAVPPLAL